MKRHHWLAIVLTLWIMGCQSTPPPTTQPTPMAATTEQLESLRAAYKAQNPNVDVGMVEDVYAEQNLAQVNQVDAANYKVGDTVCFIDAAQAPLVCGTIVRIVDGHLDVKYENPPSADRRAPMKGDLAVAYR